MLRQVRIRLILFEQRHLSAGFTLIELVITLTVLAILTLGLLPLTQVAFQHLEPLIAKLGSDFPNGGLTMQGPYLTNLLTWSFSCQSRRASA